MSLVETLKDRLTRLLKMDLELIVNENKSTMLNLLDKNRKFARLSIHKMFLDAPDPVIGAIAHYVRGVRKERSTQNLILRQFIQEHLSKYDYTHLINKRVLSQKGKIYDLEAIYFYLNEKYFQNQLNLSITWYGRPRRSSRTRITFGQYLTGLRLIKIHRMLDDRFFPDFFVSFVVYHEMLHSIVPGSLDGRGRFSFHSPAFKEQEKVFEHYRKAIEWEKRNKSKLFNYQWI